MIRRAFLAVVALLALGQAAIAGVPLFGHVSCGVVRFYVSKYSEAAAENWARGHGAGEAEIERARRCLHPASVQTASSTVGSKVLASVTGQERTQDKPAERIPNQEASAKGQHADPKQDKHNDEPPAPGFIRPDNTAPPSARDGSQTTKVLASSDRKISTLRRCPFAHMRSSKLLLARRIFPNSAE